MYRDLDQKIIYKKDSYFTIIPKLCGNDLLDFKDFIDKVEKTYTVNGINCFFWSFDEKNNSIIINKINDSVENDIYMQLVTLIYWLLQRKYIIEGSFFCRIGKLSEFITIQSSNKIIHYTVMDDNNERINNIYDDQISDNNVITKINIKINDLEEKVNELSKNNMKIIKLCTVFGIVTITSMIGIAITYLWPTENK